MKTVLTGLLFIFLMSLPYETVCQTSSELNILSDNIINSIESKKSEWKHKPVSPMSRSDNVILQQSSFEEASVRIAIVSHGSVSEAVEAMQSFSRRGRTTISNELADGDVTWGRGTVSFRKQHLTVNVSAVITRHTLDVKEAGKQDIEQRKLAKEFARLVSIAIKDK